MPAEDGHAALRWVADHAAALGGRPGPLLIAGRSAGGNIAAVTCQLARDRGGAGDRRPAAGLPGHRRHGRAAFIQPASSGAFGRGEGITVMITTAYSDEVGVRWAKPGRSSGARSRPGRE